MATFVNTQRRVPRTLYPDFFFCHNVHSVKDQRIAGLAIPSPTGRMHRPPIAVTTLLMGPPVFFWREVRRRITALIHRFFAFPVF